MWRYWIRRQLKPHENRSRLTLQEKEKIKDVAADVFSSSVVNRLTSCRPSAMSVGVSHLSTVDMFTSAASQQGAEVCFLSPTEFLFSLAKRRLSFLNQENTVQASVRVVLENIQLRQKPSVFVAFVHGNATGIVLKGSGFVLSFTETRPFKKFFPECNIHFWPIARRCKNRVIAVM